MKQQNTGTWGLLYCVILYWPSIQISWIWKNRIPSCLRKKDAIKSPLGLRKSFLFTLKLMKNRGRVLSLGWKGSPTSKGRTDYHLGGTIWCRAMGKRCLPTNPPWKYEPPRAPNEDTGFGGLEKSLLWPNTRNNQRWSHQKWGIGASSHTVCYSINSEFPTPNSHQCG